MSIGAIVYRDGPAIDLATLSRLRQSTGFPDLAPEVLRGQLEGARWVVTAWDEDRLVGFARAISDGVSHGYVSSVMVEPTYQRRGIGREIMRRLMGGRDDIRWVLHTRKDAAEFYRALGYEDAPDFMWRERR